MVIMADSKYDQFGREPEDMRKSRIDRIHKIPEVTGIYKITFMPLKISYIGAAKNIRKRCYEHFRNMSISDRHSPVSKFYRCYGIHAFKIEILKRCQVSELQRMEQHYLTEAYIMSESLWNTEMLSGKHREW